MRKNGSKRYPRTCPVCGLVWFTPFMDPRLTCGKKECRQE
ncbi:unnamed protein product, partial [marine sediment metagenome]